MARSASRPSRCAASAPLSDRGDGHYRLPNRRPSVRRRSVHVPAVMGLVTVASGIAEPLARPVHDGLGLQAERYDNAYEAKGHEHQ
jgi:hypothetical protein